MADHIIEASNALSAIEQVEKAYGETVKIEFDAIENEHNRYHPVMTVNNWYGYIFAARAR